MRRIGLRRLLRSRWLLVGIRIVRGGIYRWSIEAVYKIEVRSVPAMCKLNLDNLESLGDPLGQYYLFLLLDEVCRGSISVVSFLSQPFLMYAL